MNTLGRKIAVVGVSASGKSTFARKLAAKTGLPLTHMDAIWWKPGWTVTSEEDAAALLRQVASGDEWIIEGYVPKLARPLVFERADTILYLDYPGAIAAVRYIRRWWTHRKTPRPELEGSPDRFKFSFLKLVWTKGEAISLNKFLATVENKSKILTFTMPGQAKVFLNSL